MNIFFDRYRSSVPHNVANGNINQSRSAFQQITEITKKSESNYRSIFNLFNEVPDIVFAAFNGLSTLTEKLFENICRIGIISLSPIISKIINESTINKKPLVENLIQGGLSNSIGITRVLFQKLFSKENSLLDFNDVGFFKWSLLFLMYLFPFIHSQFFKNETPSDERLENNLQRLALNTVPQRFIEELILTNASVKEFIGIGIKETTKWIPKDVFNIFSTPSENPPLIKHLISSWCLNLGCLFIGKRS